MQKITMHTKEIFYVVFSKTAQGVKRYYIVDFKTKSENSNIIIRSTLEVDNIDNGYRPITVFNEKYDSVHQAYLKIRPDLSYSSICKKTKNESDSNKINEIFKRTSKVNSNKQGLCHFYRKKVKL